MPLTLKEFVEFSKKAHEALNDLLLQIQNDPEFECSVPDIRIISYRAAELEAGLEETIITYGVELLWQEKGWMWEEIYKQTQTWSAEEGTEYKSAYETLQRNPRGAFQSILNALDPEEKE
jgi:hypothetical protein